MSKTWKSMLSLLLVFVFVLQLLPTTGFAVDQTEKQATSDAADNEEINTKKEIYVVGEVDELREEAVKHFRMSDGSYTLVEYDESVHYQDEHSDWQEIDNTLKKDGDKYVSVNGPIRKTFSSSLANGELFEISYNDHRLSMSLLEQSHNHVEKNDGTIVEAPIDSDAIPTSVPQDNPNDDEAEETKNPEVLEETCDPEFEIAEKSQTATENDDSLDTQAIESTSETSDDVDKASYSLLKAADVKARVSNSKEVNKPDLNSSTFSLEDAISKAQFDAEVRYDSVIHGTDLAYSSHSNSIKESIIIKEKQDSYTYSFALNLDNLMPVLEKDGSISLNDGENKTIFVIPAPWMRDANGEISDQAEYALSQTELGWVLTVSADKEWLNADERVFPVELDPTINRQGDNYIQTISLLEGSSIFIGNSSVMTCGYKSDAAYHNCIVYTQLRNLPQIPSNCVPVSAKIGIMHSGFFASDGTDLSVTGGQYNDYLTVEAHPTNKAVANVPTLCYFNITSPLSDVYIMDEVLDYQKLNKTTLNSFQYWDITSEAVKWMSNPDQTVSSGIVLKAPNGSSENRYVELLGSAYGTSDSIRPCYVISYRNAVGLEEYYTRQTASAGRAGDVYVNDFTTQLTAVHPDLTFASEATPFTLSHIYNSSLSGNQFSASASMHTVDFSSMRVGCGWKLSVQQSVVQVNDNGTNYLIYTDADGTEHSFYSNNNTVYYDEDGLNLKITKTNSTTYEMTDKDENKLVFYNGYLVSRIDHVGNAIHFAYNNNYNGNNSSSVWKPIANSTTNKLVQIVSVPNGQSATTICTFTYQSGELNYITDYAERRINFNYANENGQRNLKSIQHIDYTYAQYEYDSETGRIATLFDQEAHEGLGVTQRFVLGRWATNQISEFAASEVNGTRTVGNAFHAYRNSPQMTSYRFYGPDHTSDTSDDIVSFYEFDYYGHTICQYNSDYLKSTVLGASASIYTPNSGTDQTNNRISKAVSLGMEPLNLLNDIGVEDLNSAWVTGTVPSTGTAGQTSVKTRTGSSALKLSNTSSSSSSTVSIRQSVSLTAGKTYTFSGYVNTSELESFSNANSGAYLAFTNSSSSVLAKSDIINFKTVENIDSITTNYDFGWEKVSVTYKPSITGTYYVAFMQKGASGSSYCDDLQLEKDRSNVYLDYDATASSVNLIKWASDSWTGSDYSFVNEQDKLQSSSAEVEGDITQQRRLSTVVQINKPAKDLTFVLSGWAKAHSIASAVVEPDSSCWRYYGLVATITYIDSTTETHYVSFNKDMIDWQYASGIVVPEKDKVVDFITVSCAYDYNSNSARFNNISLIREPVNTYSYDANGNVLDASNSYGKENGTYDSNNLLTTYTSSSGAVHSLGYDGRLLTSDQCNGITTNYSYNDTGSVEDTIVRHSSNNYLKSSNSYSSDGHYLTSSTDIDGNTTSFEYNSSTRNPYSALFPNNEYQYFTFSQDRLAGVHHTSGAAISYHYDVNGRLRELERKNREYDSNSNTFDYQNYVKTYDSFGNTTQVAVNRTQDLITYSDPIVLASYEYEGSVNNHNVNNGRVSKYTFANGDTINFTYDMFDRVKTATYNDGTVYHYHYDANGNVSNRSATNLLGSVYHSYSLQYDSLGRLSHSRQYNGTTLAMTTSHFYDTADRLVNQYWQFGNNDCYGQAFVYGDSTHGTDVLHSLTISTPESGNQTITYDYNNLHQLTQKQYAVGGSNLIRSYSYLANPLNSSQKTTQIGETKYTRGSTTLGYTYQYDSMGNIIEVHKSSDPNADYQTYSYDSLGQMTFAKDTDIGKEYTYTYDLAGNIQTVLEHPTGSGNDKEKTYQYDNASWKDLLTSVTVNGTTRTISYPTNSGGKVKSGTPLSWYNGSSYSFSWIKGTRLASAKKGNNTTAYYAYDMAGLRTSKTIGLVVYNYTTLSGKVMRVSWGNSWMDFTYDESGQPFALIYKSSTNATPVMYYYLLNKQGDVMALMNSNGTIAANYQYDPWGAVTVLNPDGTPNSTSTFIGNMNPLRYRGYYYDKETGFYYLQSRYYDPAIGRFISADCYASTGQNTVGCNMFAYCNNNPICFNDTNGHRPVVGASLEHETTAERKQSFAAMKNEQYADITDAFDAKMNAHAEKLSNIYYSQPYPGLAEISTGCYFAVKEKSGGDWDLKNNEYPFYEHYIYRGEVYSGEDLGNIHYGYVGSAVFSPLILHVCAGGYQVLSDKKVQLQYWLTLFDEPRDYEMVSYGIQLYSQGEY